MQYLISGNRRWEIFVPHNSKNLGGLPAFHGCHHIVDAKKCWATFGYKKKDPILQSKLECHRQSSRMDARYFIIVIRLKVINEALFGEKCASVLNSPSYTQRAGCTLTQVIMDYLNTIHKYTWEVYLTTELAKKACPRLRDLTTAPAHGITQPRTNLIWEPCMTWMTLYPEQTVFYYQP